MKFNAGLAAVLGATLAQAASVRDVDARSLLGGLSGSSGSDGSSGTGGQWACGLSDDNLNDLIDGYTLILSGSNATDFNATAARILSSTFTVHSDSINLLAGRPLGQPSFTPGRAGFVAESAASSLAIPTLTTTDVFVGGYWNNTDKGNSWWGGNHGVACADLKVSWRWTATGVGSGAYPVNGMVDLVLLPSTEAGQDALVIDAVYVEFSTAAWIMDLGVNCAVPGTSMNATGV